MSLRKVGVALAIVCASLLVMPVVASAQTSSSTTPAGVAVKTLKSVPITGSTKSGKQFKGHFNVTQFTTRHGKTYAVGTLTGHLGNRHINRSNVAIPASVMSAPVTGAAACPILHLVLGPLHLNLLGLHVNLNTVVLDITAVSGPGNLLGNLLCGVSNLLNGTGATGLLPSQTAGLLNIAQQLLNVGSLLSL